MRDAVRLTATAPMFLHVIDFDAHLRYVESERIGDVPPRAKHHIRRFDLQCSRPWRLLARASQQKAHARIQGLGESLEIFRSRWRSTAFPLADARSGYAERPCHGFERQAPANSKILQSRADARCRMFRSHVEEAHDFAGAFFKPIGCVGLLLGEHIASMELAIRHLISSSRAPVITQNTGRC